VDFDNRGRYRGDSVHRVRDLVCVAGARCQGRRLMQQRRENETLIFILGLMIGVALTMLGVWVDGGIC